MCTIKEGEQVILRRDNRLKVFEIKKNRPIYIDKSKFSLDGAIGQTYGSVFQVLSGKLVKVKRPSPEEDLNVEGKRGEDNRELLDSDSNQKLTSENINKMKEEGIEGESIIEHLIENSATFKTKTEYSQEKYLLKKKKRHVPTYTVLKPTTRLLCDLYLANAAKKICYLRMDTLAQMLTYANVQAGITLAVVDNCQGLVLGAVLERMMGYGKVVHLFPGTQPTRPALTTYNFPPEVMQSLYSYPLPLVSELYTDEEDSVETEEIQQVAATGEQNQGEELSATKETKQGEQFVTGEQLKEEEEVTKTQPQSQTKASSTQEVDTDSIISQKRKQEDKSQNRKEERKKSLEEAKNILKSKKLDGLIIASNYDPTPILYHLTPFVQPSRPIVVYSQFQEPLMDCHVKLREKNDRNIKGVNFRLTDSWLREYQVLPERTHPLVRMNSSSGYLLTFTTVVSH